ncbi:MAG: SPOR domain-containing protein [Dehalococcoidia bacterium]
MVLPVLVLATGCAGLSATARQQLIGAYGQYCQKDYRSASSKLDIILHEYPRDQESAEAYYLRALCRAELSQRNQATSDALSCIRYAKESGLRARAHAMAGSLMFEADRTSAAIPHFAEALRSVSDLPEKDKDLVRYRYGLSLQREGRWKKARLEFAAVFQRYPTSDLAAHARRMYDWPHDSYSIQCGAFRDRAGATKLMAELKKAGLGVRVEPRPRGGEPLQMVYVGRYPLHVQARDALLSVRRRVPDALIVP